MRPGAMLTTAQALTALDVTTGELASLIATGLLCPEVFSGPGIGRYQAGQIEALLNRPGGVPRDERPGLLHALSQTLAACAGSWLNCQLRHHRPHPYPHLLIRTTGGTQLTVWAVPTSAGCRYWWGQGRSHPAADPPGAATAITAGLAPASTATGPPTPERGDRQQAGQAGDHQAEPGHADARPAGRAGRHQPARRRARPPASP